MILLDDDVNKVRDKICPRYETAFPELFTNVTAKTSGSKKIEVKTKAILFSFLFLAFDLPVTYLKL